MRAGLKTAQETEMNHDQDPNAKPKHNTETILDYPGYCLTLSLVFSGALGFGALLYTL